MLRMSDILYTPLDFPSIYRSLMHTVHKALRTARKIPQNTRMTIQLYFHSYQEHVSCWLGTSDRLRHPRVFCTSKGSTRCTRW